MEAYLFFNVLALAMSIGFVVFLKSKRGEKWLREL